MAEKKKAKAAPTKSKLREQQEAEARGDTDMIQITNDSGGYRKLKPEEWEEQKAMLMADGWKEMGDDSDLQK